MLSMRNDITKVKEINVELIKSALKSLGTGTKAQIADITGISVATCGKILNELCTKGEVQEVEALSGGYGRPAMSYAYNGDFAQIACLYVETDKGLNRLVSLVTNLLGEVRHQQSREVEDVTEELMAQELSHLKALFPKLSSVAVGIPGYILEGAIDLCNFAGLIGCPLERDLRERFPDLKILVENDTNAAAYGYYQELRRETSTPVAYLYSPEEPKSGLEKLPAGMLTPEQEQRLRQGQEFGAGFVSEGQILRGATGFAGEVSFVPMGPMDDPDKEEGKLRMAAHIIASIVPILNPGILVLSGGFFTKERAEKVEQYCLTLVARQHMPRFVVRGEIHEDYVRGLIQLALSELSCGVALVERRS